MIMISSEAGVRMAKAGKALEKANQHVQESKQAMLDAKNRSEEMQIMEEHVPLSAIYKQARIEWTHAVAAVFAELYEQNLHEMTGP